MTEKLQRLFVSKTKEIFSLDLRSLALFRIALSFLIVSDLIVRATSLKAHYTDFGILPRSALIERFGSPWAVSLHFINGSVIVQALLFVLAGVFALMLLVGYRTRLAAFLSWVMMISLHARNPMVLQAGDVYFRMLLFWSLFLPLGGRWSIDRFRKPASEISADRVLSVATVALFLQVAFVYWFTAAIKLAPNSYPVWWKEGSAVYYALSINQFTKPLGYFLLGQPFPFLKLLDYGSILFESLGPFLLFFPFFNAIFRTLGILGVVAFHLGLGLSLELGPFSWVACIAVLPLVPSWIWEKIAAPSQKKAAEVVYHLPRSANLLVLFFLIYVLFWNVGTVKPAWGTPERLKWLGVTAGLEQRWNMFSPPLREDGWYVIPGKLKNGKTVDLLRGGKEVSWEKPNPVVKTYKNERWRKYMMNIWLAANKDHRLYFGKYLCRDWNSRHKGDEQVEEFEIFFMKEFTPPYGQTPKAEKVSIWKHWCFKKP